MALTILTLLLSLLPFSTAYGLEKPKKKEEPSHVQYVEAPEHERALDGEYIPVLMYHHFALRDMKAGNDVVTTTEELEDHLKYFSSQGYEVISLEKLEELLDKVAYLKRMEKSESPGMELNKKYLCITMDDGYYSNYELGYPLFQKYCTPVSIFAVTDFITEQTGIKKFTWEQAMEMEESGYVRIYSHTADHEPVVKGKEEDFLASAQRSETALQEYLNRNGLKSKTIAYPNGRYTEKSQQLLNEDGYVMQFTIEEGVITAHTERDQIPRITVTSGMDGRDVVRKIELAAEEAFAAQA